MATNYDQWNKWDEESASRECERSWEVDGLEEERSRAAAQLRGAASLVHDAATRNAEALKSRAAVESLKAATGGAGGRARRKQAAASADGGPPPLPAPVSGESGNEGGAIGRLADALGGISSELSDILQKLHGIRSSPESRDYVAASFNSGVGMLAAISVLGKRCLDLSRRDDLWARPEADSCRTLLSDLDKSILSLYQDASSTVATLALNLGELAVASDMSRCRLKISGERRRQEEAVMFVVRGLAFLAMGNAHLCLVHLKQAQSIYKQYPGLSDLVRRVDIEVKRGAHARGAGRDELLVPIRNEVKIALRSLVRISPSAKSSEMISPTRLDAIHVANLLSNRRVSDIGGYLTSTCSAACCSFAPPDEKVAPAPCYLHIDEMECDSVSSVVLAPSPSPEDPSADSDLQWQKAFFSSHRAQMEEFGVDTLLSLSRRTFFEGQMLYIESLMRSAEIKYLASVEVGRGILSLYFSDCALSSADSLLGLMCAGLVNAASCRASRWARTRAEKTSRVAEEPQFEWVPSPEILSSCDAMELMEVALYLQRIRERGVLSPRELRSPCPSSSTGSYSTTQLLIKKGLVAEKLGRYSDALLVFELVERALEGHVEAVGEVGPLNAAPESSGQMVSSCFVVEYADCRILLQSYMCGGLCNPINFSDLTHSKSRAEGRPQVEVLRAQLQDVRVKIAKARLRCHQ